MMRSAVFGISFSWKLWYVSITFEMDTPLKVPSLKMVGSSLIIPSRAMCALLQGVEMREYGLVNGDIIQEAFGGGFLMFELIT
mmetsp:Transcript_30125/g.42697  ORF Transcript_30125/g.42697 Transcript_30125/m.42697 type:complete len:83 (+) Transcript_30125:75-323(+)